MEKSRQQESSALARCQQLAKRSAFDLSLAHDAGVSAHLPFAHLARIKRARREMNDLLRELSGKDRREEEEKSAA
ncbi:MAG: hypothetical protein ACR2LC_14340 [Pyrinomonadaceae bacterium]